MLFTKLMSIFSSHFYKFPFFEFRIFPFFCFCSNFVSSALYTVHCALYTGTCAQCTVYTVLCALCTVHCTLQLVTWRWPGSSWPPTRGSSTGVTHSRGGTAEPSPPHQSTSRGHQPQVLTSPPLYTRAQAETNSHRYSPALPSTPEHKQRPPVTGAHHAISPSLHTRAQAETTSHRYSPRHQSFPPPQRTSRDHQSQVLTTPSVLPSIPEHTQRPPVTGTHQPSSLKSSPLYDPCTYIVYLSYSMIKGNSF